MTCSKEPCEREKLYLRFKKTPQQPKLILKFKVPSDFHEYATIVPEVYEELEQACVIGKYEMILTAYRNISFTSLEQKRRLDQAYGEKVSFLGKGAKSAVYEAKGTRSNYIVKIFNVEGFSDLNSVIREFVVCNELCIEGVIKCVDIMVNISNFKKIALVFHSFNGVKLSTAIETTTLSQYPKLQDADYIDSLFSKVLMITKELHHWGVFHNNLTTSNILYDEDTDSVMIVDFKLAMFLETPTALVDINMVLNSGDKRYLPIEKNLNANELEKDPDFSRIGKAKDSWALGIVYYNMLSHGKFLWDSPDRSSYAFSSFLKTSLADDFYKLNTQDHGFLQRNTMFHQMLEVNNSFRPTPENMKVFNIGFSDL